MKKYILLAVTAFLLQPAITQGVEGDLIIDYTGLCFIERAGGVEEQVDCPSQEPQPMSETEVTESLNQLKNFESNPIAEQVKKAALESDTILSELSEQQQVKEANPNPILMESQQRSRRIQHLSQRGFNTKYPLEVRKRAIYLKGDRFITKLTVFNDRSYPKKYAPNGNYYSDDSGRSIEFDSIFGSQQDEIILRDILGNNFKKFAPEVVSVTEKFVSINFLVKNSTELERLLQGMRIRSITHVGSPDTELENLRR